MLRELWRRIDYAMIGNWIPTILIAGSAIFITCCGIWADKKFFLFFFIFVPLYILMLLAHAGCIGPRPIGGRWDSLPPDWED